MEEDNLYTREESPVDTHTRRADKSKKIYIILVVLLGIVIVGSLLLLSPISENGEDIVRLQGSEFETALSEIYKNPKEEIAVINDKLEQLLGSVEPESDQEARIRILIAQNLLMSDTQTGYEMLREVAAHESYSRAYRAFAIQAMADFLKLNGLSKNFALTYVFVGEPYANFISTNTVSANEVRLDQAIKDLYEYSLQQSSSPISEFRVAEINLETLLNSKLSNRDREALLESAIKHYKNGIKAIPLQIDKTNEVLLNNVGYIFWLQAVIMEHLVQYDQGISLENVEAQFQKSLKYFYGASDSLANKSQRMWANYEYALFLVRNYGEERRDDISGLLQDFISLRQQIRALDPLLIKQLNVTKHIIRLGAIPEGLRVTLDTEKKDIRELATMNEDFAGFLKDAGWKGI